MIDVAEFRAFCERELVNERGQPIRVLPWWEEVAAGLRDKLEVVVKTIRQQGKSLFAGAIANYVLFHSCDSYILLVAASEKQARAIAAQKFRRPIEANPTLARDVRLLENRIEVPALRNVLEIVPASEATSPGRTVTLLILDEAREIADELYVRLKPSTLACEGRTLVTSSPGPPRGFFYELCNSPGPETHVFDSGSDVINPFTSERHMREAAGRAHLFPGLYAREYRGEFADLGDEFIGRDKLDLVIDPTLENRAGSEQSCFGFLDLSRKRDLTSLVVLERTKRDDEQDLLTVVRIVVLDPRRFPGHEIDFGVVRAMLVEVFENFNMRVLGVDDRAEAGELLHWARRQSWGGKVRPVAATAQMNMEIWGRLAEYIAEGTIRLPKHRRLIDELLSLRTEEFASGRAWRVIDSRRRLHRDVSMSLAGAVWIATTNRVGTGTLAFGRVRPVSKHAWEDEKKKGPHAEVTAIFGDSDFGHDFLNQDF